MEVSTYQSSVRNILTSKIASSSRKSQVEDENRKSKIENCKHKTSNFSPIFRKFF